MNSVLQCLTHTPPLAEVLLTPRPLASSQARGTAGAAGQVGRSAFVVFRTQVKPGSLHASEVWFSACK